MGFETTGPLSLRPECGKPEVDVIPVWGWRPEEFGVGVLLPRLWWWGVVFDLWIVVASIDPAALAVGFDNAIFDSSENFRNCFVL